MDLPNHATKSSLKNATSVDRSKFAKKVHLACLKFSVDKLDINKLKNVPTDLRNLSKLDKLDIDNIAPVPVDLSKLNNVVKILIAKNITPYNAKIKNIEDKISDITNFATKTNLNPKINEVKGEISSITNLGTTTAFTAVENKILNVNNLVKKSDYNAKINKIENKITDHNHDDKHYTTPEFNKLINTSKLTTKSDISNFVNTTDFDEGLKNLKKQITPNKTKPLPVKKKIKKLQTFDSINFLCKSYFEDDVTQNCLVFPPG